MLSSPVFVAPRAGAWIETRLDAHGLLMTNVAPRAGAWIETLILREQRLIAMVAPRAGAWIETSGGSDERRSSRGRAPCGRVD